ncbi:MAG: Holliday junction resolvase RuvX [bacterium]
MRILGLDWGQARIGVSVSDPLGMTAQPLFSIENNEEFIGKLKELIKKYDVGEIVLGDPKQMNGKSGVAASKVREFHEKMLRDIPVKLTLWDERLTTKIAQQYLSISGASRKRKKSFIDAAAAGIILQSYIDLKRT